MHVYIVQHLKDNEVIAVFATPKEAKDFRDSVKFSSRFQGVSISAVEVGQTKHIPQGCEWRIEVGLLNGEFWEDEETSRYIGENYVELDGNVAGKIASRKQLLQILAEDNCHYSSVVVKSYISQKHCEYLAKFTYDKFLRLKEATQTITA